MLFFREHWRWCFWHQHYLKSKSSSWLPFVHIHRLCTKIFLQPSKNRNPLNNFFHFSFRWIRVYKSDIKGKLPVFTYVTKIALYIINARHPTSEYFHIREYYDIFTIVSWILLKIYKHATNVFNMCVSVLIDIKLYTRIIRAYDILSLSVACLIAHAECTLVVH